jgi:hypothetical protein
MDKQSRFVRAIDYLMVSSANEDDERTPAGHAGPVSLRHGVRIEQLDHQLAERIFDASSLRGENWDAPRQYHAVHAYVREAWSEESGAPSTPFGYWDHDRRLWPTVQLSRLVRDNNASTEHAVQRQIRADGSEVLMPFDGYESHVVYRLYPERDGWLDIAEAVELRDLLEAHWDRPDLPPRIGRALREVDAVTTARYLQYATPWAVGAWESLLKVGRQHLTAQFSQRVPAMAAEFGIELAPDECAAIYDDRSALVHGAGLDLSQPHDADEPGRRFNALMEALRRIIRKAIQDRNFAATFLEDPRITARWPTVVKVRAEVERII